MANSNRKSQSNQSSWKDRISTLLASPVHQNTSSSSQQSEKGTQHYTELKSVGDEDWCVIDGPTMDSTLSTTATNGASSTEHTPISARKKALKSSPNLGPRSSSVSTNKSPKLGSPHSLQRSSSSRGRKPTNLEVVQNGSSQRSVSPGRSISNPGRSSSPSRSIKKSSLSTGRVSSPVNPSQSHDTQSSAHQNGTKSSEKGYDPKDESSLASKIRDTLRISRPKKKKGTKGKGLAYSVTPVEINMNASSKYNDPFETSYAENGEAKTGRDHDFKPASIPHNKPEYCDHCGETAWGLYRQVLKCSKCDFIVHRKCEQKVVIDCSSRLEQGVLSHDKQVEDVEIIAATEDKQERKEKEPSPPIPVVVLRNHSSHHSTASSSVASSNDSRHEVVQSDSGSSTPSTSTMSSTSSSHLNSQLLMEKTKLSRKIREYNRKTTPVHHIHLRSSHNDPSLIEYQGFVRVHMCVQRPIHVSTAITRTSWYRLMRPVKERTTSSEGMPDGFETAFYLPTDTNRLVHIINTTTTKELVSILLKKFCVTDNPKKFSLYEEYGSDCRRLFEEDHPLEIVLDGSCAHRNSKLVLRDNTYSTIQWDAFSLPELTNFIQILQREEEIYMKKLEARFAAWRLCISQAQKERCMEEVSQKTQLNVASSKTNSSLLPKSHKASPNKPPTGPKRKISPTPAVKVESVV